MANLHTRYLHGGRRHYYWRGEQAENLSLLEESAGGVEGRDQAVEERTTITTTSRLLLPVWQEEGNHGRKQALRPTSCAPPGRNWGASRRHRQPPRLTLPWRRPHVLVGVRTPSKPVGFIVLLCHVLFRLVLLTEVSELADVLNILVDNQQ